MKLTRLFKICSILSILTLISAQWPSEQESIETSFGEYNEGFFSNSVVYSSFDDSFLPYESGEVIFYQDDSIYSNSSLSENNLLIVHHTKDYRTQYYNFNERQETRNRLRVEQSVTLGSTNGKSEFAIFDSELEQWINPYLMLPVNESSLIQNPISNPVLISRSGEIELFDGQTVSSKNYILQFSIAEGIALPKRVKVSHLGQTICDYNFESLKMVDGDLFLNGSDQLPVESIWRANNLIHTSAFLLIPGRAVIEITIENQHGNESKIRYTISVLQG